MSLEFTTAKKRKDPIEFTLDGRGYSFVPQKTAGIMLALADDDGPETMRRTFDWLSDGMSEEDSQAIIDKLKDPDDEFDIDDLQQVISGLQEEIAGRPTTSPGGSSASSKKTSRRSTGG